MDKNKKRKSGTLNFAIENPKNDRIAVIYSVKVSSVRILEKPRNPKKREDPLTIIIPYSIYKYMNRDDCLFILHFHAHDIIVHEIAVSYMMVRVPISRNPICL